MSFRLFKINAIRRFRTVVSLAVTALMVSNLPCVAADDFKAGVVLYGQGKYKETAASMEAAIKKNPANVNAMYYAALSYHRLGQTAKASALYKEIMVKFPASEASIKVRMILSKGTATQAIITTPRQKVLLVGDDERVSAADMPDSESISFRREPGGHLIVDVQVNGRTQPFIFDTGAEGCVIGKNQLAALGINPGRLKMVGYSMGIGGSVPTYEMDAQLQLGRIKRTVPLSVHDKLDVLPLLGQSFFGDMRYDIDNAVGRIRFTKPGSKQEALPHDTIDIPFMQQGKEIVITVKVNGNPVQMYFDTGAQRTLFTVQDVGPSGWNKIGYGGAAGIGGGGMTIEYQVDSIEVGSMRKSNFQVSVMPSSPIPHGLLGQDFFGNRKYVIDYERHVLRFVR